MVLRKNKDILFQLVFKLKDSVIPKDKIDINIEEATFATISDNFSNTLSTKDNYKKVNIKNTEIKVK